MKYQVGKTYLVPCIKLPIDGRAYWLAILDYHRGDITGKDHYHIDVRFVSDFLLAKLGHDRSVALAANGPRPVEMVFRKCRHDYVPIENFIGTEIPSDRAFAILERRNKKKTLNCSTMKCPHQGCDLSGLGDGKEVVCPCHGLRWSLEDGRLLGHGVHPRLRS